ncbi:MAG: DNA-directed DNA polymerase [Candidatus Hadarchaeum sp.]|uniref:DNA-directed DNA polymerase n=1 Tax=Candidatus Hadarchaeum sp. TaxID=2883567 RepID=UPI003D0FB88F
MRGLLLDIDFAEEEERPNIRLFVKTGTETVVAVDTTFEEYFYVVSDHPDKTSKLIEKIELEEDGVRVRPKYVEIVKRTFLGCEVEAIRVSFYQPKDAAKLRHKIRELPGVKEIYEFDLPTTRRYLIDRGLTPMAGIEITGTVEVKDGVKTIEMEKPPRPAQVEEPKLNIMSFDIEVYNPTGSVRPDKDPIIMISLADNRGLRKVITWKDFDNKPDYVEVVGSEREVIKRFVDLVKERDVDILLGYNTDLFDLPYIRSRAKQLKVKLDLGRDGSELVVRKRRFATASKIRGRIHVDVFAMVDFLATIGSIKLIHYSLGDVYRHFSGKEKPDFEFSDMVNAWEKGGDAGRRFLEYSMSDADAALEVGLELLPLFLGLTRVVGQTLFDVQRMTPGQLVEWLLIAEAHRIGELVPPRPVGEEFEERVEETFAGAYVMEPVKGLHEDLVVFDFRSLYPSIIVTHNIDPSTLNCKDCRPGEREQVPRLDYYFCKRRRGFIPTILQRIIEERTKLKAELKKIGRDSKEYRVLDARQWAMKIVANSFYGMLGYPRARWYSKQCAESVTSFGRYYIQRTIEMAREFGLEVIYGDTDSLHCKLKGKTRDEAMLFLKKANESLPGIMELELEGFYPRGIFITKKRYAMIDDEGRMVVKGLEFVRRDWAAIAKRTQEEVLKAILLDGSPKKAAEIIRKITRDVYEGRVNIEDLIIYTQLKMPIESYKAIGPHVVAAKRLRKLGHEIEPGMMIAYIEVKGPGSISDRAVPVEDFKGKEYDPDYYVGHQILPAVMRIMEVLGYREEDLKFEKERQVGLDRFMR